jgi:ATP-dependent exoDNAse (exonuclease V) beta subunit
MSEQKWTAEQRAAFVADQHTLLVANAGTGKTTTIVQKILWLLGFDIGPGIERCPDPCKLEEIAAITFTEKAAYDLKKKLREEIEKRENGAALLWELEQAAVGTIHSFCGQLLRDHALRMGIDPTFTVLDEQDARLRQDQILRDVIIELLQTVDEDVAELVRTYNLDGLGEYGTGTIDVARAAFRDMRWHSELYDGWCSGLILDVAALQDRLGFNDARDALTLNRCRGLCLITRMALERWRRLELTENVRDFDSLILDARDLLTGEAAEPALAGIRRRYRILIIDEFQDTDGAQRDIAYAIARKVERPQLFLVGDPKQSIYRFRGANIAVWNEVQADFAQEREPLTLTENFRSDPVIIAFANAASEQAIEGSGREVEAAGGSRVSYSELKPARPALGVGHVEWRVTDGKAVDRRTLGGQHIAELIREFVDNHQVVDIDSGEPRKCNYRDVAVLYRTRTDLECYKDALSHGGIPFHENSPLGLAGRQEILDILNLLRLLANPFDDLRAFAFLRSPFVGLRDEVLTRIRMSDAGGSYLYQARRFLETGDWWPAPEHALISEVERGALKQGLELLERAARLVDRVPLDELLTEILELSGYRNHLLLLPGHREALANIDSFVRVTEQFRDQTIGGFLELWDERDKADPGIPQGQLYSRADDVVTLSTVHAAKGLEWPVVFLVDVDSKFSDRATNDYWTDAEFGPILCPKQDERGARANHLAARAFAESIAEEARLMYVAVTRARDKLILVGKNDPTGYAEWLQAGVKACDTPVVNRAPHVLDVPPQPPIDLAWLDVVAQGEASASSKPLVRPPHRWMTSATEMMSRQRDEDVWRLMYHHGVEPSWQFAPRPSNKPLPERVRGDIIHGVLERMREDAEIAQILEETIGELGAPELEMVLAPGSEYRAALHAEIEKVIQSPEWAWYVAGDHHRELPFLYLAGEREWYVGAFDLYRPDGWIIDFKTHQITAALVATTAEGYRVQMELYRRAAGIIGPVRTQLHFTHPGVVVEIS